jgi:hypothetical protein
LGSWEGRGGGFGKGENRGERGWVRGLAVRVWDRKRVGGGREREKKNFLKVKNIILII